MVNKKTTSQNTEYNIVMLLTLPRTTHLSAALIIQKIKKQQAVVAIIIDDDYNKGVL